MRRRNLSLRARNSCRQRQPCKKSKATAAERLNWRGKVCHRIRSGVKPQPDHIGIGDTLRIKLPGGPLTFGKVFFKSAEADFATQRDVSRSKRDIKTIVLKVRLDNPKAAYVPGMTADVLVSPAQLRGAASSNTAATSGAQP